MIGKTGRVSGTIGPGLVGEVIIAVRGGSEAFLAYLADGSDGPDRLVTGTVVLVVDYHPPRTVYVTTLR
jgi:hypothetical protein